MAANLFEGLDADALGDHERTMPQARSRQLGHPSAQARAPRIEFRGDRRAEPTTARRILAEPTLIDAAFRRDPPAFADIDPAAVELLLNRR